MYGRIFAMVAIDPLHNGHLRFFEAGLEQAEGIDVHMSIKSHKDRYLPFDVRRKSLEALSGIPTIDGRLAVMPVQPGLFELSADRYDGLMMGSDLANRTYSKNEPGHMHQLYKRFKRLFIVERVGNELDEIARANMQSFELICHAPVSDLSSTKVRGLIRSGEDVRHLIPEPAYNIIEPYFDQIRK